MNAKMWLHAFALGSFLLTQVAAAPAGKRYCEKHPEDPRCSPTVTPEIRKTEFPPIESTPTDIRKTQIPSETPETPAPTEKSSATPTASATPGQDPATPTPTSEPELNSSCQIHEEYVNSDWTAWYATYQGGYNESVVWAFTVSGTDWVGMWLGLTAKKANLAARGALIRVLVLPWLIFLGLMTSTFFLNLDRQYDSENFVLAALFAIGMLCDLYFYLWARTNLRHAFRTVATQRFDAKVPSRWRFLPTFKSEPDGKPAEAQS